MILSFSVPSMLPYIRAGVRQRAGEDIGTERVKRQTIRPLGPRNRALLDWAKGASWTIPYDLQLWWKSRTPAREFLGTASYDTARHPIYLYPLEILHSTVQPTDAPAYPVLRIVGPHGWRKGDAALFWSEQHGGDPFAAETHADGFETLQAFREFFVPNIGDRFTGVLFKW